MATKTQASRERFKALLSGQGCVIPGSVWDPLSARSAEVAGYEIAMFAGSVASLAIIGAPDIALITLTEFAEQARRICRATALPLLVDADHGYGNALNVMRTVEELETAGIAALTIEDTHLPQPFETRSASLISIEEGFGKMQAAVAARQDRDLTVIGRTGATAITGVEDACERCKAYADSGVDAIFVSGVKKRAELEAIAAVVGLPLILGTMSAELSDTTYLASLGVKIALEGHLPIAAATRATHEMHLALRQGKVTKGDADRLADYPGSFSRQQAYQDWSDAFLQPRRA